MSESIGESWQIVFEPVSKPDSAFDEFVESYFEVVTIDYTDQGLLQYSGCLSHKPDEKALNESAKSAGIVLPHYKCVFVPAQNWLTKNVIKFPPLETEDFLIYGAHEDHTPKTDKLAIKIYAATAFGSGQHQTTRLCLKLLSSLNAQGKKAENILDMGCGSGILALSACKLWESAQALGVDIDGEAVAVTLKNAADNKLDTQVHAIESNGFNNHLIDKRAPFQLIFANILARPLIEMAPDIAKNLQTRGWAVLSGFIDEQVDWIKQEYKKHGMTAIKILNDENWYAILMEKIR